MILLLLTISACKTIEYVYPEYELPEEPQRQELQEVKNLQDAAEVIIYYKELVEKWEKWAESVKELLKKHEEDR